MVTSRSAAARIEALCMLTLTSANRGSDEM